MLKSRLLLSLVCLFSGCASIVEPNTKSLHFEDAQRFAELISNGKIPDQAVLQKEYLDKGSLGVEIFTPYRIEDAKNLHANLVANIGKYRHAAEICLPIVKSMEASTNRILDKMAYLLGEKESAPVFILFGANNSGGTANGKGLAIGLEVTCDGKTKDNAARSIEGLIAHESAHVYQNRYFSDDMKVDLLFMALMEGGADFLADLALNNNNPMNSEQNAYGMKHEAELWREFKKDYEDGVFDGNDWFYSPGRGGRPKDLGYFIGKRICQSYYAKATDKRIALRTLVELKNPKEILKQSGYGEKF